MSSDAPRPASDPSGRRADFGAGRAIRVVLADDSPTVRLALKEILAEDTVFDVVGAAKDGREVVEMAATLSPDLILMDVSMPLMDGFEATRRIMRECPTPIVVFSGIPGLEDASISFDAIDAGAVDVMTKPDRVALYRDPALRRRILARLKNMAQVAVVRKHKPRSEVPPVRRTERLARVIAVGASTGGPPAVRQVLRGIGPASPPVLLVQHMAVGFIEGFARWLGSQLQIPVSIAVAGEALQQGCIYIAPADCHLELARAGYARVHGGAEVGHHRPAVELLMGSVAKHAGALGVGVILTGMGRDGAKGFAALAKAGGYTLAQAPSTCVVPSMPNAAIEACRADVVGAPDEIGELLAAVRFGIR